VQVFLIRHATAAGRSQARGLGDRLRWHDCHPTQVWTSPLVRAVQTAELVVAGIGCDVPIEVVMNLAPDGSARDLVAAIGKLPANAQVVLVGHEPSLSGIGAVLVGASDFEALDKAQAARIDHGTLRWRFAWDAEAPVLVR